MESHITFRQEKILEEERKEYTQGIVQICFLSVAIFFIGEAIIYFIVKAWYKTAERFTGPAVQCKACDVKARLWKCDACGASRPATDFDVDNLKHASSARSDKRVCMVCREAGYDPADLENYLCHLCGPRGHAKFDEVKLARWRKAKVGKKPPLQCLDCTRSYERQ